MPYYGPATGVDLVNGVEEFGIDVTGTQPDNSSRINSALLTVAQEGLGLFLPAPNANTPGIVNLQNPIILGNQAGPAQGVIAPSQGGILVGSGFPTLYKMTPATPFQQGFTTLKWNGTAGGTMIEICGPLQGWELRNLYLYANALAANGIYAQSAQFGKAENLVLDGFTTVGIQEYCNTNAAFSALGAIANTMHNRWRKIGFNIPVGATGWFLGQNTNTGATCNTCYEDIEEVYVVLPATAGSTTIVFEMAFCDSCRIRNVHVAQVTTGTNMNIVWIQTAANNNSWPCDNIIENIDMGNVAATGGSSVAKHGVGFGGGATPNIVGPMGLTNGISPNPANVSGGMANLVWRNPNQPTGPITTPPAIAASGTAVTNNFGVPCQVFVNGGTVSAVAIGGTATGETVTGGSYRVPVGGTITLTYSVAPTWTWFGD